MTWRRDFSLPGKAALDQPGDDGAGAEGALHQRRLGEPGFEVVAQHVLVEQRRERQLAALDALRDIAQAPDRQRIFVGDETERPQPGALQPARQQHAERLVREPPFERIADEVILVGAREGLDQKVAPARHQRTPFLDFEPFAHLVWKQFPGIMIGKNLPHAVGKIGRERKLAALVGRDLRVFRRGARDIDLVLDDAPRI